jgi:hypothetical protein
MFIFLWYLLGYLFSGSIGPHGKYSGFYSLTKSELYPKPVTSKVLEIPYYINDQTQIAANRNRELFTLVRLH